MILRASRSDEPKCLEVIRFATCCKNRNRNASRGTNSKGIRFRGAGSL
jgi:hypothetical protein